MEYIIYIYVLHGTFFERICTIIRLLNELLNEINNSIFNSY